MFKNYITVALRNLKRQKLYAFINIFGLALGIACCILMTLFVKHEWSHDRFHQNRDQIFRIVAQLTKTNNELDYQILLPHTLVEKLKTNLPSIMHASTFMRANRVNVEYSDQTFKQDIGLVGTDFLSIFSFPLVAGDPNTVFKNKLGATVITEKIAKKLFDNTSDYSQIIGQTITINGKAFEVSGIAANISMTSSIYFDALISEEYYNNFAISWSNNGYASIYVQLPPEQSLQNMETTLRAFAQTHLKKRIQDHIKWKQIPNTEAFTLILQPLLDMYWNTEIDNAYEASGNLQTVYILWGLAGLILFIACCNFTTLSISNSTGRALEVGLRKVLGANRPQLMKQFWSEALLLSLIGLILGIALAELFLPIFNGLIQRNLQIAYLTDAFFLFLLLVIVLTVGLVAGSYPATVLSRFQPISALKGEKHLGGRNHFTRILIVLQYTASITLIIATTVMVKQQHYMSNRNLGYEKEQIVVVWPDNRKLADLYKQEILKNSYVLNATITDRAFTTGSSSNGYKLEDGTRIDIRIIGVDPDYLETLNVPLLHGRNFSEELSTDKDGAVIINESLANALKMENPIGQLLKNFGWSGMEPTIVGIAKDFHIDSLHRKIQPLALQMKQFSWGPFVMIRVRPDNLTETIETLKSTYAQIAPNRPFNQWFLDQRLNSQYRKEQRWQKILTYSSIFTIAISCLGLLGLASLAVSRRTKEIGIRKVLGASVPNLVNLLTLDFVKLLLIANVIAWPIAYYAMEKWLTNFAYHIELGIGIFALSGALALGVALLTVGTQTFKAARSNPVDALRYE